MMMGIKEITANILGYDSPTDWQVVISLLFEITPNSSTLEANRIHVGASRSGSIHFKEFLA